MRPNSNRGFYFHITCTYNVCIYSISKILFSRNDFALRQQHTFSLSRWTPRSPLSNALTLLMIPHPHLPSGTATNLVLSSDSNSHRQSLPICFKRHSNTSFIVGVCDSSWTSQKTTRPVALLHRRVKDRILSARMWRTTRGAGSV